MKKMFLAVLILPVLIVGCSNAPSDEEIYNEATEIFLEEFEEKLSDQGFEGDFQVSTYEMTDVGKVEDKEGMYKVEGSVFDNDTGDMAGYQIRVVYEDKEIQQYEWETLTE